ncbi:unnamed protein product [Amoebophrya sp. A120]|nr:unnamed protein product [Amoebophrya sp. A120]|eukprot:GSA120T00019517001.1
MSAAEDKEVSAAADGRLKNAFNSAELSSHTPEQVDSGLHLADETHLPGPARRPTAFSGGGASSARILSKKQDPHAETSSADEARTAQHFHPGEGDRADDDIRPRKLARRTSPSSWINYSTKDPASFLTKAFGFALGDEAQPPVLRPGLQEDEQETTQAPVYLPDHVDRVDAEDNSLAGGPQERSSPGRGADEDPQRMQISGGEDSLKSMSTSAINGMVKRTVSHDQQQQFSVGQVVYSGVSDHMLLFGVLALFVSLYVVLRRMLKVFCTRKMLQTPPTNIKFGTAGPKSRFAKCKNLNPINFGPWKKRQINKSISLSESGSDSEYDLSEAEHYSPV